MAEDEIVDIMTALPKISMVSQRSIGPHSIPINFLKIVADIVAIPLCRIINLKIPKLSIHPYNPPYPRIIYTIDSLSQRGWKIPNHNVTLLMNNKTLEQKDHVKYLGFL